MGVTRSEGQSAMSVEFTVFVLAGVFFHIAFGPRLKTFSGLLAIHELADVNVTRGGVKGADAMVLGLGVEKAYVPGTGGIDEVTFPLIFAASQPPHIPLSITLFPFPFPLPLLTVFKLTDEFCSPTDL